MPYLQVGAFLFAVATDSPDKEALSRLNYLLICYFFGANLGSISSMIRF